MQQMEKLLQSIDLLKKLPQDELQSILSISFSKIFLQGELIFMQEDPLEQIFFISEGMVKIYRTDQSGKEQIVSILKKGDVFPHTGFFRRGTYPAHAEAMEKTTLLTIPVHKFEDLLLHNPNLTITFFRVMEERIIDLQNRLEEQIFHNTYEKVLLLLVRLGKQYGQLQNDGRTQLNTRFTHRELANMIGTTRETINRTFTQLKKDNIVTLDEDGFIVMNSKILKEQLSFKS